MSLYIQLRDEILYDLDEVPVRQYWIKADSIEVLDRLSPTSESLRSSNFTGIAYLDSKTGEWRVVDRERGKFYMGGKLFKYRGVTYPINKELEESDIGYDFLFIRDRLMQGWKLGDNQGVTT